MREWHKPNRTQRKKYQSNAKQEGLATNSRNTQGRNTTYIGKSSETFPSDQNAGDSYRWIEKPAKAGCSSRSARLVAVSVVALRRASHAWQMEVVDAVLQQQGEAQAGATGW